MSEGSQTSSAGDADTVRRNYQRFDAQVRVVESLVDEGRLNAAAVEAEIAAAFAEGDHCGLYASPRLERSLRRIGTSALGAVSSERSLPATPSKVLHVVTDVAHLGGIPRLLRRWVEQDKDRSHSLCLTSQHPWSVPANIREVIAGSGGAIHFIGGARGGLVGRAARLRSLVDGYELVVAHGWECDAVPTIAFADRAGTPPLVVVNHGDGKFWLGATVSDLVVNLRASGMRLSTERRGFPPERNVVLPTPMTPGARTLAVDDAKRRAGLDPANLLLLSIARAPKYRSLHGQTFADAHVEILRDRPDVQLVVVGPGSTLDWSEAQARVPGQIQALPESDETGILYQAADIYVDSFPFVSITSLLEAGSFATPLISRHPFPDDGCEVYGADMPGLDERLIVTRSLAEYHRALKQLLDAPEARATLGAETRTQIMRYHTGPGWLSTLESVYARAYAVSRREPMETDAADDVRFGPPDSIAPVVYGHGYDTDWFVRFVSGSMDGRQRWRHWRTWQRRHDGLDLTFLMPDHLKYRVRRVEAGARNRLARLKA